VIYLAPKLLGPRARPLVELEEVRDLREAPGFAIMESRPIGEDLRLRLRPRNRHGIEGG
jgi:diaminohydroxyphosphoribosylaminopyrimidine deaminase/5-amino-6-(5-phosphoribosylamino)uracil reductase